MAGTLLRRGLSLLAHNEHLPCEMVVQKRFPSAELPAIFIKKCPNCSRRRFREGLLMERMDFRVTWQGDWLMAALDASSPNSVFLPLYVNESQ